MSCIQLGTGHGGKTRLSFYSNDDSIRTNALRQKIHNSYWPTAEIHSSGTRIDSNVIEHPTRVWLKTARLSKQPFLLRKSTLAEGIWSGWRRHLDRPSQSKRPWRRIARQLSRLKRS